MFIKLTTTAFKQQFPEGGRGTGHGIPETKLVTTTQRFNISHIVRYHDLGDIEKAEINRKGDRKVKSRIVFANNSHFVCESAEEIDYYIDSALKARVAQGGARAPQGV